MLNSKLTLDYTPSTLFPFCKEVTEERHHNQGQPARSTNTLPLPPASASDHHTQTHNSTSMYEQALQQVEKGDISLEEFHKDWVSGGH